MKCPRCGSNTSPTAAACLACGKALANHADGSGPSPAPETAITPLWAQALGCLLSLTCIGALVGIPLLVKGGEMAWVRRTPAREGWRHVVVALVMLIMLSSYASVQERREKEREASEHLTRGVQAIQARDYQAAILELEAVSKDTKVRTMAEARLYEARQALGERRLDEARLAAAAGDYKKALAAVKAAEGVCPGLEDAVPLRARCEAAIERQRKAREEAERRRAAEDARREEERRARAAEAQARAAQAAAEAEMRQFIQSALPLSYDQLARNPEVYSSQNVVLLGTVAQSLSRGSQDMWLVAAEGDADALVYVTYSRTPGDSRLREGDVIRYWGVARGLKTYEAIGGTRTVPLVEARAVEIINTGSE